MIEKTYMLESLDKIHYRVIDTLADWLSKEGRNLTDFINNPSGHLEYNPYVIIDFSALEQRVVLLKQAEEGLRTISGYKKGIDLYSRSQHDALFEQLPLVIFERLLEWMEKRAGQMEEMVTGARKPTAGTDEYAGLYTFNQAKFYAEYSMYKNSVDGLRTLIQYRLENIPVAEETTTEEPLIEEIPESTLITDETGA